MVNMEKEELTNKKIRTISYFGGTTLEDSASILKQFDGDVVKSVEYAKDLEENKNPIKISDEAMGEILNSMKPYIKTIQSQYTSEELASMHQKLQQENDTNRGKFIERLIYSYMNKLN